MKKTCAILLVLVLVFSLSGCGEPKVTITPNEADTITLSRYDNGIFSMDLPDGWEVSYGGTEMLFGIHAYKPEEGASPKYHVFALLKAEPLHSHAFKAFQEKMFGGFSVYDVLTKAPEISEASVEGFYKIFNTYGKYAAKFEPSYVIDGYEFYWPEIYDFEVIDEFALNSAMADVALDDKVLRANFSDKSGETLQQGLFAGSLTTNPLGNESYSCYNAFFVSAPDEEFPEYESLLLNMLNSIEYSDEFVSNTVSAIDQKTQNAIAIGKSLQATCDACNRAWEERNKSYDIISQKQSDATLGYERVYDTETGDVYKAVNGFTDYYDGKRYQPITEDMYAEPVQGYIE